MAARGERVGFGASGAGVGAVTTFGAAGALTFDIHTPLRRLCPGGHETGEGGRDETRALIEAAVGRGDDNTLYACVWFINIEHCSQLHKRQTRRL